MTTAEQPAPSPVARLFDAVADDYDRTGIDFFGPIADGLLDGLGVRAGDACADLGCGRGAVTVGLAERALPAGRVVGIDISDRMLEHARTLLAEHGDGVELRLGDASDPDLESGAWDVVASSLVLFFLPDPLAALTRWVGLLAPGGRIGIATFGDQDPVWSAVDAEFGPWLPPAMRDPRTTGPDSPFATDAGMEDLMARAGAGDVRTTSARVDVRFGDAAGWERFSRATGQRAMWASLPENEIDGVRARAAAHLEGARDADGRVVVWQDVRYTWGTAPPAQ
ncbi:methyltransferase domain-containing protein [Phycicoccus sp. HDW14]|uniref:class I SAM-dependent methyltransferase n=1 Tax=Phycicoccus sp. HDW14 TaxID=2714941 RepID=UPI00140AB6B0|nr:class I SAM-dependent methyltransferase [Phycicoccus sp. HDW14]QIM20431.1 methyltransferase domain-containing protein [Phycicoccus sp. HDW14]